MAWNLVDTHTLMALMRHTEAPSNYWLNLLFGRVMNFTTEYIDFEKIKKGRKLAPFVSPMQKGKVLTHSGSTQQRFKPAYVKPKDALDPNKMLKRRAGEAIGGSLTPSQRRMAIITDYVQDHRDMIDRRLEWLACRAAVDGAVTIASDDYPAVLVDFGRDANHTVTKTTGTFWGDSGVDIMADIETWVNRVERAPFGGPVTRMTVTPDVFGVMKQDATILKNLDTRIYGNGSTSINLGAIMGGADARRVGILDGSLELYVYQDWYEADDGTATPFLDNGTVVLSGPAMDGVRCFGAIQDFDADFGAMDIYTKMFDEKDPSAQFILSQSAPLMVPVNPNATLKATVLDV